MPGQVMRHRKARLKESGESVLSARPREIRIVRPDSVSMFLLLRRSMLMRDRTPNTIPAEIEATNLKFLKVAAKSNRPGANSGNAVVGGCGTGAAVRDV